MLARPYIVGIGASAGGLEAIIELLHNIPSDTGAAFVIIRHLPRNYASEAQSILSRHTNMPLLRAHHRERLRPNTIYLLMENTIVTVLNGFLVVRPRRPEEVINQAVDIFFHSLAFDMGTKAVGIVLSGMGADGAQGAIAIHEGGGVVMVQEPQSTPFKGMPQATIEQDSPDVILPPRALGKQLVAYLEDRHGIVDPTA